MLILYLSMLDTEEEKLTFTNLYTELKLPCLHVALAITKNQTLAEDAIHNAFLSVIKHKDKIFNLSCGKRKSLIVIITKNKAIDLLRIENKRTYMPVDEMEESILEDDFDLSKSFENQEALKYLLSCIAKLPEIYRTTFELRYVHEMSNSEIADLLDLTPKAVSMRISRAKIMLKEMIEKEGILNG